MIRAIRRPAPAKLNLYLHITGRRETGYHELDSLVCFLELGDRLDAADAPALTLDLAGPLTAGVPTDDDNLVLRAARALAEAYSVEPRGRLQLEKRLPSAAGLGGGSADAAAALLALIELWRLPHEPGRLADIGLGLGADLPICLWGRPALMRGIGERLLPAPALPPLGVILVNPGTPLATGDVFAARAGAFSRPADLPASFGGGADLVTFLAGCRNDLEAPARSLAPAVGTALQILEALPGARLARMAGSGATCFALFDNALAAGAASARLDLPSGWWWAATAISQVRQV